METNMNINDNNLLWFNNIQIIFQKDKLLEIWPLEKMNREEKINAISRFIIYLTILGLFFTKDIKILLTSTICLFVIYILYFYLNKNANKLINQKIKETFSNKDLYNKYKERFTNPSKSNPLMNVILPEIQDNPHRNTAAPAYNKAVEPKINENVKNIVKSNFNDENIDKKLFENLGDKFQFDQSMRQFYTTANTQIPNNQHEFSKFCYGNMASCKDGDVEMCLKNNIRHTNI